MKIVRIKNITKERNNKMKNVKRIFSVLLAVVFLLGMTCVASADTNTPKGNITINDDIKGTYYGYMLLNATNSQDTDDEGKVTADRFAYTLNSKYTFILQNVIFDATGTQFTDASAITQSDIISYIEGLKADADAMRTFADAVYRAIQSATTPIEEDAQFTGETSNNVNQGYWLIADVTDFDENDDGEDDTNETSHSLVMVDTVGITDAEVNVKKDVPTVEKKVKEINDSVTPADTDSWQDAADFDKGDEIEFKLTGTVSDKIGSYITYYYEFHDSMKNMTYVDGSVSVKVVDTSVTPNNEISIPENYSGVNNYTVEPGTDNKTLDIKLENILSLKDSEGNDVAISGDTKIVVTYKATLDKNATIGSSGNDNSVFVEYSNDPYDSEGIDDPTGTTTTDTVTVFTYKLVVDKLDGDKEQKTALKGAGFTLYKYDADKVDYVAVGDEITETTTFTFTGLDAGIYKLVETTVPAGYNKADDLEFKIVSTLSGDPQTLTDLKVTDLDGASITVFTATLSSGELKTEIVNNSGSELPTTGSIGTVVFYVLGGVIFAGALILLIVKLRMRLQNEE